MNIILMMANILNFYLIIALKSMMNYIKRTKLLTSPAQSDRELRLYNCLIEVNDEL